jgi:putative ABC transport system permease protein
MTMVVRAAPGIDPATLAPAARQQLRDLDPQQPIIAMRTFGAIVSKQVATRRFTLVLLAAFAATALLLAVVGLYAALSYVVLQRQREIGVRMALGAERREIRRLVMGQGLMPVAAGVAIGIVTALIAGRLLTTMLFGVAPTDVITYAVALGAMILSATLACLLPARRATRVQPAAALRS